MTTREHMTITEVAKEIEAETNTLTWDSAPLEVRLKVIEGCIDKLTGEPEQAAKKVVKVRKVRKPKTVPLTQHVEGNDY